MRLNLNAYRMYSAAVSLAQHYVKFIHIFFLLHNVLQHDCTTICVAVVNKYLDNFQIFTVINNATVDMLLTFNFTKYSQFVLKMMLSVGTPGTE